jgi:hypothetical protein
MLGDQDGFFLIVITVDDTIDICTKPELRKMVHNALKEKYTWQHMGICDWHLGMRVIQTKKAITIDQTAYLDTILERFSSYNLRTCDSPMTEVLAAPPEGSLPSALIRVLSDALSGFPKPDLTLPTLSLIVQDTCEPIRKFRTKLPSRYWAT